jgi:transmembrane sensor
VELNLGTELVYSNYKDQRRVTLKKGEAFFKVSHDSAHPFIVHAGEGQVRVTGTQFNVWKYEDHVRVMLLQGSVQISCDRVHGSVPLTPGMQASYRQGDATPSVQAINPNDTALAWRQGKLILDNLALADALPLINRYLNKPVMLADANTGAIRIGGIYNITEVNNLVPSLPKVLPVRFLFVLVFQWLAINVGQSDGNAVSAVRQHPVNPRRPDHSANGSPVCLSTETPRMTKR